MLVDTDVLIWNLRGNARAADLLDAAPGFSISAVTYMELVQGMRDKRELRTIRQALSFWSARIVQIDTAVSARACFLVEQHAQSHAMRLADALIAATALELGIVLLTANDKHYKAVDGLELKVFRP
ncbi:type II toxin-antitoxin system VapC family toxin [Pseudothauera rhizosphaerae]|uniref:Ribonuclease VapC n=1 Tax=Pseudothauera rhizosphaerae TaxID=2565932 RepID=A0A4S4AF16_9RHOO|nr:type II toxin-antitoxin system VapC family toxin [Pseudothauera rhizosphaerae]THF57656.1 type II toxin-antitoxin system VapC family toxin [Pseudothauera rhizosphaerae]